MATRQPMIYSKQIGQEISSKCLKELSIAVDEIRAKVFTLMNSEKLLFLIFNSLLSQ